MRQGTKFCTVSAQSAHRSKTPDHSFADFAVIGTEDVESGKPDLPRFLSDRAQPTKPLRLTVHLTGLMVMLVSAPLGAFMFTYSLLRDALTRGS